MIVAALEEASAGRARAVPQPASGATHARKIDKRESAIDWRRPAVEIERTVRALRPTPGAATRLRGEPLKIWRAGVRATQGATGTVLAADEKGVLIACGEQALLVTELQRAGGKRLAAADFLRGCEIAPGERLS